MEPSSSSATMDDTTQPIPQPDAASLSASPPFTASALAQSAFSVSSPSFSSLSSSSSSSQSAPSSFSSTFPSDVTSVFNPSSPSFPPFSFPAVPDASSANASSAFIRHKARPFRAASSGVSKPLLHAGSKRGSLSRTVDDDDEDEEAIDDDMPTRRMKLKDDRVAEDEEEEEEDEQVLSSDEELKGGDSDELDAGEDTFATLLTHFAALHVPSSSTKPEQCPICSKVFPLSDFADHVYSCLTVLDEVERREQERLDEKMARQLMAREVRLLDENERNSSYSRDRRAMGSDCPDGADCQRTDAQHFQLRSHPEVPCPMCATTFPLFDIYSHVTSCMQDEAEREGKQATEEGDMQDETSGQESRAKAAIDTSSSAFSSFRADRQRREAADDDSHLPIARDSDDDDDDRKRSPSPPLNAALDRPSSASPPPSTAAAGAAGGSSNLRLTVEQASAVASMIREKQKGGGDESVAAMLDTFKQLGFTQENLTRLKVEQQQGKSRADEMDRKG